MKFTKLGLVSSLILVTVVACSSSTTNNPVTSNGNDAGAPSGTDSGMQQQQSDDAGTQGGDSGMMMTADGGGDLDGGLSSCMLDGTWSATAVSCNGEAVSLGALTWVATLNGSAGTFTETINACSYTESGPVGCTADGKMVVERTDTTTCNPAACQPFAAQCGMIPPGGPAWWQMSQVGATSFVLTSADAPDGTPTPIKTCTAQGKSNPIQVTWTKM